VLISSENNDEQSRQEKESQRRVRVLLGIEEAAEGDSYGDYGLGKERTLGEYEEFSGTFIFLSIAVFFFIVPFPSHWNLFRYFLGVYFKKSIISEKAKSGGIPKESFKEDILNMILAFSSMLK
jgi:hypothetical protein